MGTVNFQRMTCSRGQREGFTLLELLVVVGILATLVALALPYYQDYINQSRITAAQADLTSFSKALALYDQQEPEIFNSNNFLPLIGKYTQDYRTYPGQTMPKDPWGSDYVVNTQFGAVICYGPNAVSDTTLSGINRIPGGDDILTFYKPPFFISSARAINATTLEIVFSRRVTDSTVPANAVSSVTGGGAGASTAKQRIAQTIYRFILPAMTGVSSVRTVTMVTTITSQDGQALDTDYNPSNPAIKGNIATFTYPMP